MAFDSLLLRMSLVAVVQFVAFDSLLLGMSFVAVVPRNQPQMDTACLLSSTSIILLINYRWSVKWNANEDVTMAVFVFFRHQME